ncbi:MAG TPA: gamma-glutamyl-gamma-aminobutyrate hydrolase family protein [Bryobacteraceae bacterium]|nr:gamma-glutamyl-gamma-aminobutyrate hydrolase family protein [Bryobacteraceae bacterium]
MKNPILMMYRHSEDLPAYREAADAAGLKTAWETPAAGLKMEAFSGLILTGGSDVDPALYGEERHPKTEPSDGERDREEIRLLNEAMARDLPVLAICRGLQLMNVALGGTLTQHLDPPDRHRVKRPPKSAPVHEIKIEPGTLLASIAGTECWQVNSRHHQAVKKLGAGLRTSATDPMDGTVEAIERPDKAFVLGVQWHPENLVFTQPDQLKLFLRLGEATG